MIRKASEPCEVTNSVGNGPYAVCGMLGWAINSPLRNVTALDKVPLVSVHRIQQTSGLEQQAERFFNFDYSECHIFSGEKYHSVEHKQFLEMVGQQSVSRHGRYVICLPVRECLAPFPNNCPLALQRMKGLQKRFLANESYKKQYTEFLEDLFVKGHASKVPADEVVHDDDFLWYLSHHGIVHPHKDNLIGVLLMLREGRVAFISEFGCMFYQVRFSIQQRDLLRLLCWPGGDVKNELIEYQMHTHIFGASGSPPVAPYALHKTALDNAADFSLEAVETVRNYFYMDNCLKSVSSMEKGLHLFSGLRAPKENFGRPSGSVTVKSC